MQYRSFLTSNIYEETRMNISKLNKIGLSVLASSIIAAPAHAALEEVVVTAQKREQSLQDVGLTVSAYGGERLKEAGVSDVVDIAALSPNVQVNYGLGNNFFNIRGLGLNEFVANLDAPVAVHVDEVYQSKGFMTGMALFDMERVEVLKGPQGDLFGRNTTGGAVNFITARPEAETSGYLNLSYDNYSTINVEGAVTGAITDNLSGRLSGYRTDQSDGFYQNRTRNEDEGRVDELGLRGQLLWELDNTEVLFSVHYGRDKSELHPYEGVGINRADGSFCPESLDGSVQGNTPNCLRGLDLAFNPNADINNPAPQLQPGEDDPFISNGNLSFDVDNESVGGFLRVEHEFGDLTFTSITGYEDFDQNQREDSDESPIDSVQVYWYTEFEQFTQEFRLSSETDKSSWIAGFFYEKDELYNGDYLTAYEAQIGGALNNYSRYTQDVEALAIFAHYEYQINDSLRLISGARYTEEETELVGGTLAGDGGLIGIGGEERPANILSVRSDAALAPGGNTRDDSDFSYKLGLNWNPSDNTLVYGSFTTGFRSGGYSIAFAGNQSELQNLEPEEIEAIEVGFKSTLLDNTLQINGSAYYYDVEDAHIDVDATGGVVPVTVNAGKVKLQGVELDMRWSPTDSLDILAGVGWTDSEIESDLLVQSSSPAGLVLSPIDGNRTAFNPEWTINGQVRYEQPISNNYDMVLSTDFSWRDEAYLESNNQPANLRDAYWLINARAAVKSSDGKWEAALWGKNLSDEAYQVYLNDLPAFGWLLNGYAAPRTYGVSLNYNF